MKYWIVCFFTLFSLSVYSQKSDLPTRVSKTFEKNFPGVVDFKWTVEKGDYKIKCVVNGKKTTVEIDPDGTWEKTSTHIAFEALPEKVRATINQHKKELEIDEIKQVVNKDGETFYRIELMDILNKTKLDILADGKVIKSETDRRK
jgi:hypothetical protein